MPLPYYKKYPRDFVEGTIGMPLETKGAYSIILDMIYMQDGELPDDPRYISGMLGCSVRKWKSIRNELINAGKLYAQNDIISNKRADKERESLRKLQHNQAEKGRLSNKNNKLPETTVKPARVNQNQNHIKKDNTNVLSKEKRKKPATPMPDGWRPTDAGIAFARKKGMTDATIQNEVQKFIDGAEQHNRKYVNWDAAWRTWCGGWVTYGEQQAGQKVASIPSIQRGRSSFLDVIRDEWEDSVNNGFDDSGQDDGSIIEGGFIEGH